VSRFDFPGGKKFAFTVLDDTDVATVANVRPLYDLFHSLGFRTTKTVWPVGCPEGSRDFSSSETLDDPGYVDFVADLQRRGFEITWHGATMESSPRERTLRALERFHEVFGAYPRIHVNHSHNQENLYWGARRLDSAVLRMLVAGALGRGEDYSSGDNPASPYWWGDQATKHFTYSRNLTTNDINTAKFNPSMPYHDPARPLVPWWFSASDAEDVYEFNALIHPRNQEQLEREGGFCIVATHGGKEFVRDGVVNRTTVDRLTELSKRPGWFPTVGELLDWLRARRERAGGAKTLPAGEWRRMQWKWAWDLASRRIARRMNGQRSRPYQA
jgi:hypothetical protein